MTEDRQPEVVQGVAKALKGWLVRQVKYLHEIMKDQRCCLVNIPTCPDALKADFIHIKLIK